MDAPKLTTLTRALVGVQQVADGTWWLVFATPAGAGLPDGVRLTAGQADDIQRLLRQIREAGA